MKKLICLVTAALLVAIATPAFGKVYFEEIFDDYAVGTSIVTGTPTHNGGYWQYDNWGGTTTLPALTVVADPTGAGKGNVLDMNWYKWHDWNLRLWMFIDDPDNWKNDTTLRIEFDEYVRNMTGTFNGPMSYFGHNNNDGQLWQANYTATSNRDGNLNWGYYTNGPPTWHTMNAVTQSPDQWFHWEVTAYAGSETFDISIVRESDNAVIVYETGLAWYYSRPALGGFVLTGSGGVRATMYYDNIHIDNLPEPATIALLGLGGLLLRKRR
jgi:hypothetical protein